MIGIGVATGLAGFIYWSLLLRFANAVAKRTKENYLAAILKQETGWFDSFNYNELGGRITQESMKINKAIGEKVGLVLYAVGMSITGIVVGFVNGWSLALLMLAIGPLMGIAASFLGKAAMAKVLTQMKAYA